MDKYFDLNGTRIYVKQTSTSNLRVKTDLFTNAVTVYCPRKIRSVDSLLASAGDFISNYINNNRNIIRCNSYDDGSLISIFGKNRRIEYVRSQDFSYGLSDECLTVYSSDEAVMEDKIHMLKKVVQEILIDAMPELISEIENLTGKNAQTVKFKWMVSNFGSCNYHTNTLFFNYRLVFFEKNFIKMIVLHEYCHFTEHSHNKNFKKLMFRYMPDWKITEKKVNSKFRQGIYFCL